MASEIRLPELGENVEGGTIVSVAVKAGEQVSEGQTLMEVEAGKSTVPVPSPRAGKITEVLVKQGDEVKTNQVLVKIEGDGAPAKKAEPKTEPPRQEPDRAPTRAAAKEDRPRASGSAAETQLVIIGAGPGGYAAAFLAADRGMQVTLIDQRERPGGVCLHCGCIPSKALLHAAKIITDAREAAEWGLKFAPPEINVETLRKKKQKIVDLLSGHLAQAAKQREVTYIQARAAFEDSNTLKLDNGQRLRFQNCILASGSSPTRLRAFDIGSPRVMDSTAVLELEKVPASLLVIGGGYIGLEMGTVYAALGCQVSVVELMGSLLPGVDPDLVAPLQKRLNKQLQKIRLNTKVVKLEDTGKGIKATFEGADGSKQGDETFEKVLVAIGRRPNSANLGLENTQVQLDDKGFVKVDEYRRTTDPHIFAIGDVAGEPMLAHKASHEGKLAVEVLAGDKGAMWDVRAIPAVVFTDPEIAWAGMTEAQAKQLGREIKVAKFDWANSGRAATLGRNDGLTKLIVDAETDQILGVGMVGQEVGEMIAEGVLAVEMGAMARDLAMSIHPHPTLTETVMEAAESLHGLATHLYKPKRSKAEQPQ